MSDSTSILDLIAQSQAGKEATANALFNSCSPAALFGRRDSACSGLNWFYYGGVMLVGGVPTAIANNTAALALTANATNYIEATVSGVVSANTIGFTAGSIPLYVAECGPSTVTSYAEKRALAFSAASGASSSTDWVSGRVYHVGQSPWMHASIAAAVTAINTASPAPSTTNRVVILVHPGKYATSSPITVPSYVGIKGVSKGLVQMQNDTSDLFICAGNNWFEDFLVEGSATPTVYAFDGNNKDKLHFRRVDMLNNGGVARQKFLKQSGATWKTMFVEDCILDYFGTSGYAVTLTNSAAAARFCDVEFNNCFFDAYQLTSAGGSIQLQGVQDVRVKDSRIRGAASYNNSVRLELNGVTGTPDVTISHSYCTGNVPIYGAAGTQVYCRNVSAFGSQFDGTLSARDSFIADSASVAVTGADVTLKGHEYAATYLTTTGVLSGNRAVIVPTDWRGTVYCNNTGGFTTTIKTSGGTGIPVAQGKRAMLRADGTNVVREGPDV